MGRSLISYLKDMIVSHNLSRVHYSQSAGLLLVPGVSKRRIKGRDFSYQASLLCSQLPRWIQEADTMCTCKIRVKTSLFDKVYR